jgi:glycosyltransferase involved in cell wall biosynthesis
MFKDEADIAELILRHMFAEGMTRIIVADNMSSDGTRSILDSLTTEFPLTVVDDNDPAFYQSAKMTRLTEMAGEDFGADWVVPFDADEWWYATEGGTIADVLNEAPVPVLRAPTFEMVPQPDIDGDDPDPTRRIVHRLPDRKRCMKVAFRYEPGVRVWQGNHQVDHSGADRGLIGDLHIKEFQYRSFAHLAHKVRIGKAAYDATNLALTEGKHWRDLGALTDADLEVWWKEYVSQQVVLDPCRR